MGTTGQKKKVLDKKFLTYEQQISLLKSRNLIIKDDERAIQILSTATYYDLINGYKECFMDQNYDYYTNYVTIEDIYAFFNLDRSVQNVLFKYSVYIENSFKSALAYVISKNISEDEYVYLQPEKYKTGTNYKKLKDILTKMQKMCEKDIKTSRDNPTLYYRDNHNHVPPWILFKNSTFSQCIDLSNFLWKEHKTELLDMVIRININPDYRNDFLQDSLTTIRQFRNRIAHNLKPITFTVEPQQRLVIKQMFLEYENTLLIPADLGTRGQGDMFSMIISIVSLLRDKDLIAQLFFDLSNQFAIFGNVKFFDIYCNKTGIPEDICPRGEKYLKKLKSV